MNKSLTKHDAVTTPFLAIKDWRLSNAINEDLLLMENGNTVALEFADYFPLHAIKNASCSIALEQQEADRARYREGLKTTGNFYPDQEPINQDGTFKRMVYSQVRTMFYNAFRDPTKMWGMEKIDFETSKTKKFLADKFKMFDLPTNVFGEKIIENTVEIVDSSTDNDYLITDDGNGNLFAGVNLFSRQQELGDFTNVFVSSSNGLCDSYLNFGCPKAPSNLSGSQVNDSSSILLLTWQDNSDNEDGFVIERSDDSGSTFNTLLFVGPNSSSAEDTSSLFNAWYQYRIYSYNIFCSSDYANKLTISASFLDFRSVYDTGSVRIGFLEGS